MLGSMGRLLVMFWLFIVILLSTIYKVDPICNMASPNTNRKLHISWGFFL
jgi:hypothetical protein